MKTLALVHTTPVTLASLNEPAARLMPGARIINLLDDSLLPELLQAPAGTVPETVERRLRAYVDAAATAGASAVMSCCSSIGEVMEGIGSTAGVPVWRIDEAMAEDAVAGAGGRPLRVGIVATMPTTLEPTARLVRRKAAEAGVPVRIESLVVEGAFAALEAGRPDEHDRLVTASLADLLARSDRVVLAQATMARLLAALDPPPAVPVLTSPESGL